MCDRVGMTIFMKRSALVTADEGGTSPLRLAAPSAEVSPSSAVDGVEVEAVKRRMTVSVRHSQSVRRASGTSAGGDEAVADDEGGRAAPE